MKTRFSAADLRFVGFCVVLLAGSIWFSVRYFHTAFPEASIDFRVNREQGLAIAQGKLSAQGCQLAGYREASSFGYDDDAKTFLERELGLAKTNQLLGGKLRLWRWSYRWFRPKQKEEFNADITPSGEWVGYEHDIPEDASRPAITEERARALAGQFMKSRFGRNPATLDFVETSSVTRPHRVDRTFIWKDRDFNLEDASYRHEVDMYGDEPGAYGEYLKVPDKWTQDYERLRSKNEVTERIDSAVMMLLAAGLVVTLVQRARLRDVRWRLALGIGIVVAVLTLLAQFNEFPQAEFGYPTTDAYASFLAHEILNALLAAVSSGALIFLLTAGAEPVYREGLGSRLSLGSLVRFRGLRTRTFFLASCLGLALAGAFLAYQIVFYRVANHFGAWAPADVPYDDLLNTRFPWLFVLLGGLFPAVSEEFLFRMFAIPFLRKLSRSTLVAVVAAGFIWGFGHAGYPNQPFYIRGVEVGIVGVIMGCIMLRWGVLVGLVWHYSIDAVYTALLLFRSPSWYFRLSGAASAGFMLIPVLVALAAYWRHGGFEPEAGARNEDEPKAEGPAAAAVGPAAAPVAYAGWSSRTKWAAVVVLVLGLLAAVLPVVHLDSAPRYALDRARAQAAADVFARTQGIDPARFRSFVYPSTLSDPDDLLAGKYFLDHGSRAATARLFERYRPVYRWIVRYCRSLDREELTVAIHPASGRILGFSHDLPEEQAGADLPEAAAQQRAESLASNFGWDTAGLTLKEHSSEKKPHRRDYTFAWEAKPGDPRNLAEGHFRVEVEVDGSVPGHVRTYWKIPETYDRERAASTVWSIAAKIAKICVGLASVVGLVWYLIRRTRQGGRFWRPALWTAIPIAILSTAAVLLAPDALLKGYRTSTPFETFEVGLGTTLLIIMIAQAVLYTALAGLIFAAFPDALPSLGPANRRKGGPDALCALLAGVGLSVGIHSVAAAIGSRFPSLTLFDISDPGLLTSKIPALSVLVGSLPAMLGWLAHITALVLVTRWIRQKWLLVLIALLIAMSNGAGITLGEFALAAGFSFIQLALLVGYCRWFARDNPLAYLVAAWALSLTSSVRELLGTAAPAWHLQAWVVIAVGMAALFYAVRPPGPSPASPVTGATVPQ